MAYYQNIFSEVQIRPREPEHGIPVDVDKRWGTPFNSYLFGLIGNAQVGPIYIGYLGALSFACGLIAFEIIGLNMWASSRELGSRAVHPPASLAGIGAPCPRQYGLQVHASPIERRRLVAFRRHVPDRSRSSSGGCRTVQAGEGSSGFGYHMSPGRSPLRSGSILVLGFIRPLLMGSWGEAVPFGIFPHLDWTAAFLDPLWQPLLQPVPHALSIAFLYGSAVLFAMHGATILAVSRLRR